jgi:hypothetical protein
MIQLVHDFKEEKWILITLESTRIRFLHFDRCDANKLFVNIHITLFVRFCQKLLKQFFRPFQKERNRGRVRRVSPEFEAGSENIGPDAL